jgi:hypothetical protein
VRVGGDDDPVSVRVEDGRRPEPPQDYVARCVRDGVWLDISDPLRPYQGCGD